MRLAAGLRPDPLGELKCSPDILAAIGEVVLLLRGKGEKGGRGGKRKEMEGREEKRGRVRGGERLPPF